jgi:ribosomal-protein-alanine N-acetyltransferase
MIEHLHSFTTKRLLIRPLAVEDKSLYVSLYTDTKIMRNIGEPLAAAAAEIAFTNTLRSMNKAHPKILTWAIVEINSNRAIGIQSLNKTNKKNLQEADIGIILSVLANGKQIPEESIGSLIEYGFTQLGLKQINACFIKRNLATARVSKKTGFVLNINFQNTSSEQKIESVYLDSWERSYIENLIPIWVNAIKADI